MCEDCVKEEYPERDTVCLEVGSYLMNFASCSHCGKREIVKDVNREETEDENDEEHVTYQHTCRCCDHVIARHEYSFKVEDGCQLYEMCCLLCGMGESLHRILPGDSDDQLLW